MIRFRDLLLGAIALCLGLPSLSSAASWFLYVSVGGEKRIAQYHMSPETGKLEANGSVEVNGAPGSLCVDPTRRYLYAALRSTKEVASFEIDPKTGKLKEIGRVKVFANPVFLTTDNTGKHLLLASYSDNKAGVYPIKDGKVRAEATQVFDTKKNPHSIRLDASNTHGYIPCTGADVIQQFSWDAKAGKLTPLDPFEVTTEEGAGPRHFFFDPREGSHRVYFVNEKNSSVTAYQRDPESGQLKAIQVIPTLPVDFNARNTCADIEITPDGGFLYASNRGHDSLACYSIDAKTGKLTSLGTAPTEKMPREFHIGPRGRFIYSAGQGSGKMVSYRIDSSTGKLQPMQTYEVGRSPAWVLVVRGNK